MYTQIVLLGFNKEIIAQQQRFLHILR